MQFIDILILVIICFAAIRGFAQGLVRQIGSLGGLLLAILGAIYLSKFTETLLVGIFKLPDYVYHPLAWLLTFLVIYLSVWTLAWFLLRMVRWAQLGRIDRMSGIVFCIFKYVLVLSVILNIFELIDRDSRLLSQNKKENSYFYSRIAKIAPSIFSLVTDKVMSNDLKYGEN